MNGDLFGGDDAALPRTADTTAAATAPLADRMRPRTLDEVVGQPHLLGADGPLRRLLAGGTLPSLLLWGPPGCGKTTLARLVAGLGGARFLEFSAVAVGSKELKEVMAEAGRLQRATGRRTILFLDEIHRFNKAQQDALLPHVEKGTVVLIGATTENPSFAVNAALLSRARVFRLEPLSPDDLVRLLQRALADGTRGLGRYGLEVDPEALRAIAEGARGDARRALDVLETAGKHALATEAKRLDPAIVDEALAQRTLLYDKSGDEHYNVVSAFIKSLRGTEPDAAIYWMMRMLEAGDDPMFLLRRMMIFASEDIGNADPNALQVAVAADAAFRRLGMPEGLFAMAQCCTYLATAPKSNASYTAFEAARADITAHGALPVPLKLRNAPTALMRDEGYGSGYQYPHDAGGFVRGGGYLPEALEGARYYVPKKSGYEQRIAERLARLRGEPAREEGAREEKKPGDHEEGGG